MTRKKAGQVLEAREELAPAESAVPAMFSPASFFDILQMQPIEKKASSEIDPVNEQKTPIVAFYGFKGGAGRSTALGYVAALLARQGRKIGIVDLDLEAPGLAQLFGYASDVVEKGSMALLSEAASQPFPGSLDAVSQMLTVPESLGSEGGRIEILPAGRLDEVYLAQLEELGVGLWHAYEPERPNPLRRLLEELSSPERDALFLDCRTGFTALSATAMFHVADAIVVFLPVSDQIWDGVRVIRDAFVKTRKARGAVPTLIFVPSLVLPGKDGNPRLKRMIERLNAELLDARESTDEESGESSIVILEEGIDQDARVWSANKIPLPLGAVGPQDIFRNLSQVLAGALGKTEDTGPERVIERRRILQASNLSERFGYGENLSLQEIEETLIDSEDARAAVDRSIHLVIGAKGAGKSFLWKYLTNPSRNRDLLPVPFDVEYLVGLSPRADLAEAPFLSKDHFEKIEKDSGLVNSGAHDVFWIYWCLQAIVRHQADIKPVLLASVRRPMRPKLESFWDEPGYKTIIPLLKSRDAALEAEDLLKAADKHLMSGTQGLCLVFDGLDTGFQNTNPEDWTPRRDRYVVGLLQLLAQWRTRLKRVQFKVFLREDIWLAVKMQNRSHLEPITRTLRFEERDLWRLVLKVVRRDPACEEMLKDPSSISGDITELRRALFPLWGEKIEKGKRAYTANYILNRIQDSQERLFPRTIMQMVERSWKAEAESSGDVRGDRILRYPSLRAGIEEASRKRVKDLTDEYLELREYLEAMKGAKPASSLQEFVAHLQHNLSKGKKQIIAQFLETDILPKLVDVGVLNVIRSQDQKSPDKIFVARLYRDGLELKATTGMS